MTLKAQIAADVADVFLQTDEHAELITYYPHCGDKRAITVVVEQRGHDFEQGPTRLERVEFVELFAALDATTGIDDPQLKDAIKLASDGEDEPRWDYKQTLDQDAAGIRLRFQRREIKRATISP